MQQNISSWFLGLIQEAKHSVFLITGTHLSQEILDACLRLLEKGLAVELLIDEGQERVLKTNTFLFNKCSLLVNKGASIYLVHDTLLLDTYGIIDYSRTGFFVAEKEAYVLDEVQEATLFRKSLKDYENRREAASPYLLEVGDVQVKIKVSETAILRGDQVELHWEVTGADKVIIQGLGEVSAYGKQKITLAESTIFKVGAYNQRQVQLKTLQVRVYDELVITYDLGFIQSKTQQYSSLVNTENYPHVFGVAQGHLVKLTWSVPEAKEVKVLPFGISQDSGEHVFMPTESMQIEIHASLIGLDFVRKIQLLVFPIPVFKELLVKPIALQAQQYHLDALKEREVQWRRDLQDLKKAEHEHYKELRQKMSAYRCELGAKKLNLNRINSFIFSVLNKMYPHNAVIQDKLNPKIRS